MAEKMKAKSEEKYNENRNPLINSSIMQRTNQPMAVIMWNGLWLYTDAAAATTPLILISEIWYLRRFSLLIFL
jgi:hypothetical protein